MSSLNRFVALVLALLWLPALGHCDLVSATGGEDAAECCSHTGDAPDEPAGACLGDHCEVFENGHYRPGDDVSFELAPALMTAPCLETTAGVGRSEDTGRRLDVVPSRPSAWHSWVFAHRAASWANAPS